ncbi:MAG: ferric reductase-like transmembrane domain-containing protein [Pseudomonadota bacterium]
MRSALIWAALAAALVIPPIVAAQSPQLQWREPIYIAAGFAGVVGLVLLPLQALLIAGAVPGVRGRRVHAWVGAALVLAVVLHIACLWITSPPDVIDVLLLRSPTPFAIWGVAAMWAAFAAALLALVRKRMRPRIWRGCHATAAATVVLGTVIHAWLIEGTMGTLSKGAICLLALLALGYALRPRKGWRRITPRSLRADR